jgi:eukaryotic-like serine/threonine-protein kinase
VKVLDFGLAKALEQVVAPDVRGSEDSLLLSPTITSPAMTQAGMILGTAAYMSPEQAKGRAADKRSDVWAFGCVLYEMLTAKRAFEGEDVSDTLAAVLRGEPEWNRLPQDLPHLIAVLIRRCLERDRRRRIADISTALFLLEQPDRIASTAAVGAHPPAVTRHRWRLAVAALALILAAGALGALVAWQLRGDCMLARQVEEHGLKVSEPGEVEISSRGMLR